jgi:hypothetical protein
VSSMESPWAGMSQLGDYPFVETHDLRTGPDLNPTLLGLLPLIGVWRGRGHGVFDPAGLIDGEYDFGQEVRFSHDGQSCLHYESRTWLLDAQDAPVRRLNREVGWWRPVLKDDKPSDDLEILISHPNGVQELYLGQASGTTRFELSTDAVVRSATAPQISASHRLYGIVNGDLLYAHDLAAGGEQLRSYVSAELKRVAG